MKKVFLATFVILSVHSISAMQSATLSAADRARIQSDIIFRQQELADIANRPYIPEASRQELIMLTQQLIDELQEQLRTGMQRILARPQGSREVSRISNPTNAPPFHQAYRPALPTGSGIQQQLQIFQARLQELGEAEFVEETRQRVMEFLRLTPQRPNSRPTAMQQPDGHLQDEGYYDN